MKPVKGETTRSFGGGRSSKLYVRRPAPRHNGRSGTHSALTGLRKQSLLPRFVGVRGPQAIAWASSWMAILCISSPIIGIEFQAAAVLMTPARDRVCGPLRCQPSTRASRHRPTPRSCGPKGPTHERDRANLVVLPAYDSHSYTGSAAGNRPPPAPGGHTAPPPPSPPSWSFPSPSTTSRGVCGAHNPAGPCTTTVNKRRAASAAADTPPNGTPGGGVGRCPRPAAARCGSARAWTVARARNLLVARVLHPRARRRHPPAALW